MSSQQHAGEHVTTALMNAHAAYDRMYDTEGFFVGNPINGFAIGNTAETLDLDADGGLTILIQHESPGKDQEANWLPTPADGFFMVIRLYQPEERMRRGEYIMPPVTRRRGEHFPATM